MMPASDGRVLSLQRLALVLGLVVVVLLMVLQVQAAYLFSDPMDSARDVTKASDLELPQLPQLPQLKRWPMVDVAAAASISLFLAPTTVAMPAAQPAETAADPKLDTPITLTAVVVTLEDRRALLEVGSDRKVVPVREGTLADGWRVVKIEPDQVILERGTVRRVLFFGDAIPAGQ